MLESFEKIKIAVPKEINQILDRDIESFEFLKKDLSLNKNSFINSLIIAYFEQFMKEKKNERELFFECNSYLDGYGNFRKQIS